MSSWRDEILKEFVPDVARLTLVADPDGLLLEEKILEVMRETGFELIPFEDHISFRYIYELKYRSQWDRGEQTDLVVVLRSPASDLNSLPYDLLHAGRKLSFNLGDIFPNLSYPVVAALDRGDLDALYEAQIRHAPGQLGGNATKEFVLRHVFEIAPELIKKPSDLLRVLLSRHYCSQRIPKALDDRFIQILRQNDTFVEWPLETVVPDREAFFAFLQERWPLFLDRLAATGESQMREKGVPYVLKYAGPTELPFEHHDIKVYIDNLFVEGMLQSVPHEYGTALAKTWAAIGVRLEPTEDRSRRLVKLIERIRTTIPADDARYGDWFLFSRAWAELIAAGHEDGADAKIENELNDVRAQVDRAFASWLARRYAGLVDLPPAPPVMLHHLLRFLARSVIEDKSFRVALLIIDGLSMDQWIVLRETITSHRKSIRFRENVVFAWAPTITSVSRQTIFSGKHPILFPNSIQTTEKEPTLWSQFWADQGLAPNEIAYAKGLGDGNLTNVEELLSHPKVRIAGLVVDKVDRIMHGMELGTAGMHNQVRQWGLQGYMASLLDLLLDSNFRIFLTSDHGNVEAHGCGYPSEGAVADIRGERVRIYSDPGLRRRVYERFPDATEWPPIGLPANYLPLMAPDRKAFVREEDRLVCHGGASLEELIVPLVQIDRIDT